MQYRSPFLLPFHTDGPKPDRISCLPLKVHGSLLLYGYEQSAGLLTGYRFRSNMDEGMACEGGCVGGPSHHRSSKNEMLVAKDRDKLLSEADDRKIYDNLKSYDMEAFSMHAE